MLQVADAKRDHFIFELLVEVQRFIRVDYAVDRGDYQTGAKLRVWDLRAQSTQMFHDLLARLINTCSEALFELRIARPDGPQQRPEMRVFAVFSKHGVNQGAHVAFQAIGGDVLSHRTLYRLDRGVEMALGKSHQQGLLVGEVLIERTNGDSSFFRHAIGRSIQAFAVENASSTLQDVSDQLLGASLFWLLSRTRVGVASASRHDVGLHPSSRTCKSSNGYSP